MTAGPYDTAGISFPPRVNAQTVMGVLRPDAASTWEDPEVREHLRWYRAVMLDEEPARFRVCTSVAAEAGILAKEEEVLWAAHAGLSASARHRFDAFRVGDAPILQDLTARPNLLEVKVALARTMLAHCTLCAWECGVDRASGRRGVCGVADESRVSAAFAHMGEEAPLLGPDAGGSGTIFFTGCPARCVFCQNWETAREPKAGERVTGATLAARIDSLRRRGCANINLVGGEPTPHLPVIFEALARVRSNVPIVWNSNMYLSREAMELLVDVVDLWLPDLKYGNDECARRLSRVRNYTSVVGANFERAYGNGDMIVRHLVLPGHVDCCTKPALRWLAGHTSEALVNIMDQYHPDYLVLRDPRTYAAIDRRPSADEMRAAYEAAEDLGLHWAALSLG